MSFKQLCKKILLSVLFLLLGPACTPKSSRFGLVFTNDFADIYRIPDNTKNIMEQLTDTPTIGEYPFLVSKNGDKIIFEVGFTQSTEERQQNIHILDTSSREITNITNVFTTFSMVSHDFSADWSPDEKQFVTVDHDGSGYKIESFLKLIDFNGENSRKIPIPTHGNPPSLIQSVEWSPDGKKFVLMRGVIGIEQQLQNPGSAIWVYDLESSDLIQITDYKDGCLSREWSPTNKQIAVVCRPNSSYMNESASSLQETVRIFDVKNPGQPHQHIAFTPCNDPSWFPDGKRIVFVCNKNKNQKGLFIANSDGTEIHEIKLGNLGNPVVINTPLWSPDATQIIYVAGNDDKHTNIFSIHLNDSSNHVLTSQEGIYRLASVYSLP